MTSLITGFALSVQPVSAETITTDTNGLDAGEVKVPVADGSIPAYRAMPAQGGPFPTVLVVQEVFGVHEHIKDICRRLAKAGYYAIAPELYARQGNPAEISDIQELIQKIVLKVPTDQVMSDLDAAVAYAKASGKADTTKLAVTGFCWGGWATWMYSAHNPESEGRGRLVRIRPQAERADAKEPARHRRRREMPGARPLWRRRSEHPARDDREAAGRVQGGRQDLRIQGLPRHAARLQRRLPAELPRRRRQGRLGENARLVQGPRGRIGTGYRVDGDCRDKGAWRRRAPATIGSWKVRHKSVHAKWPAPSQQHGV